MKSALKPTMSPCKIFFSNQDFFDPKKRPPVSARGPANGSAPSFTYLLERPINNTYRLYYFPTIHGPILWTFEAFLKTSL